MAALVQNNDFAKKQVKYNTSYLYNIGFPVIILLPLLFCLVVLFLVPVEKAIDVTRDMLSIDKLKTIRATTGSLNLFKFRNPTHTGNLTTSK